MFPKIIWIFSTFLATPNMDIWNACLVMESHYLSTFSTKSFSIIEIHLAIFERVTVPVYQLIMPISGYCIH
jgi:hypothetical protein